MTFTIDFEPIGRRLSGRQGETLLEAAQRAGIVLNATCGGTGDCGNCIVRVMTGPVSEPNSTEKDQLGPDRVGKGWRLACQVQVQGTVRVHIPPESLATAQRIQIEGKEIKVAPDPAVHALDVRVPEPNLKDLRSDAARLRDAAHVGHHQPEYDFR